MTAGLIILILKIAVVLVTVLWLSSLVALLLPGSVRAQVTIQDIFGRNLNQHGITLGSHEPEKRHSLSSFGGEGRGGYEPGR